MKRWMTTLLALALLLTLCAGCGNNGDPAQDPGESQDQTTGQAPEDPAQDAEDGETAPNIFTELTGIAADETAVTVDGNAIPADLYFYWLSYTANNMEYQLQTYAMYGMYAELFDENGALVWDGELTPGMTLRQYVAGSAENSAKFYAALENLAAENGVVLTDEDKAAQAADDAASVEEAGGQEAFDAQLAQLGISRASFDRVNSDYYLFTHLTELAQQEGSGIYLEPAGYDQYATYADHILLSTIDLDTREPLSEEEIAAKYATAQDLLAQLQAAEDVETLFAQLADQYSEDTGRATNPNGYIYTPGTMVTEFEDAAAALAPGEISDIVETTYGYHILLRKDLAQGLAADPEQKAALAEEYVNDLITLRMNDAEVVVSDAVAAVDVAEFYAGYAARFQETAGDSGETDGAADNGTDASGETAGGDGTDTGDTAPDSGAEAE